MRAFPTVLSFSIGCSILAGASASCFHGSCGAITVVPPDVKITDAVTGQSICDATVVAVSGDAGADSGVPWQSYVPTWAARTDCRWVGVNDSGNFTLVVSKPGYRTATAHPVWHYGGCGSNDPVPEPQHLNVQLTPG